MIYPLPTLYWWVTKIFILRNSTSRRSIDWLEITKMVWLTQLRFSRFSHWVSPREEAIDRFFTSNRYIVMNKISKNHTMGIPTFKTKQIQPILDIAPVREKQQQI